VPKDAVAAGAKIVKVNTEKLEVINPSFVRT